MRTKTARTAILLATAAFLAFTAFGGASGGAGSGSSSAGTPRGPAPAAVVCVDDAFEPDSTMDAAKPIELGAPQSHQLCDEDWVSFRGSQTAVYAIETRHLSGVADTRLEVSDCFCSGVSDEYQVVASDDNGGGGLASRIAYTPRPPLFRSELSYPSFVRVTQQGGAYVPGAGYEVSVDCLSGCPNDTLIVPAATHAAGLNGTFFQTDLRIHNPGGAETAVDILFTPSDTDGTTSRLRRTVRVPAGQVLPLPDVVKELFGLDAGFGSLELRPQAADVIVTARTVNAAAAPGSFGFFEAAHALQEAVGPGQPAHLLQLAKSAQYRTNVGFCEVTGGATSVRVAMLDATGAELGTKTYPLPPYGHHQINDVFGALGVAPRSDVRITLDSTAAGARVLGYATVIDNATSDSILVPGQVPDGPAPFIPASASADGLHGARFRTDLRVANVSSQPLPFELRFTPAGSLSPADQVVSRTLAPGELVAYDDVLSLFGGSSGSLSLSSGPLVATSRTYNLAANGTFGDFVPSQPVTGARASTMSLYGAPSFRVNVGLVNVRPEESITLRLISRTGQTLASRVHDGISGSLQINDVFTALGTEPVEDGRLEVSGYDTRLFRAFRAFATIIDNGSNDFVYVPAVGLEDRFERLAVSLPGGLPLILQRIPAGTYTIGSPDEERGRDADETRHTATLTRPYYVGRTEVTTAQWNAVMGLAGGDDKPVAGVSWNDIAGSGGFLERLNSHLQVTGQATVQVLRLPTEAEWEAAARGGTATRFNFGDLLECDDACGECFGISLDLNWCGDRSGPAGPDPVGRLGTPWNAGTAYFKRTPNAFGLFDVHGNVWEWTADWFAPFTAAPATDPTGPASGTERVIRGGGWNSDLKLCRSANRFSYPPDARYDYVGFRLARSAD